MKMAKKTSLITGSNAKLKVDGKTLAFATDVQYDLTVQTIPIETMGRYEVVANEPIAILVSGSFSIVRYTAASTVDGAAAGGNGVSKWSEHTGAHFDPGSILTAQTVDIEIFRKTNSSGLTDTVAVKKIRNARLTRVSGSVNKRGVLMESFSFVAELMDDESVQMGTSFEEDLA
jgi:hypothetical protein